MKGKHSKGLILCLLLGSLIGFLVGGGWEIFFNFGEWKYATFYRSNDDEVTLFLVWFFFGPAKATALGLAFGLLVYYILREKTGSEHSS